MPRRVSGKQYAQAIFQLALENSQLDEWASDLQLVSQVLQDPDFRAFLNHADVRVEEKVKSIGVVLRDIHPLMQNLVNVLVTKGLVDVASDLEASYNALLDQHRGRQRVEVVTAVPLGDAELGRITQFVTDLTQKEVVLSAEVDESIMGGIVIQVGDQLLDGSTRSQLEALRNRMHSEIIVPRP